MLIMLGPKINMRSVGKINNSKGKINLTGVFKIKERRARFGRNPRTGESVPVPPRKVVVFKPGLEMKQKIK